jgi:hypothetical protein
MNVNRSLRICGIFALALLAASLAPTSASAHVYRGKFTLPFAARWGGLNLPAGEYSFSADTLSPSGLISVEQDGKFLGSVMMGGVAYGPISAASALFAVPAGEAYRISGLRLQDECVIYFTIPKSERRQISAELRGTELARLVTIPAKRA